MIEQFRLSCRNVNTAKSYSVMILYMLFTRAGTIMPTLNSVICVVNGLTTDTVSIPTLTGTMLINRSSPIMIQ